MLMNLLRDSDRKSLPQIIFEFSRCSLVQREIAGHYFTRLLYKKGIDNYLDYISNGEMQAIRYRAKDDNEQSMADILDNKILFYLYFREYDVRLPRTVAWNNCGQVTVGNELYEINNPDEYVRLLAGAVKDCGLDGVFVKPSEGSGGMGCFYLSLEEIEAGLAGQGGQDRVSNEGGDGACVDPRTQCASKAPDYPDGRESVLDLFSNLLKGSFLFQEPVRQHPDLNALYPYSLNTLRLDTFIDPAGVIKLTNASIRFGINKSVVDNAGSGGCFVAVDIDTGELGDKGYQMLDHGGNIFLRHPDTQASFKGARIPYFDEVKALVLEAARVLPHRFTGWDIAIAPDGPVLMEGNSASHLNGSDIVYGGFRKHPVYQEILKEFAVDKRSGKNAARAGTRAPSGGRNATAGGSKRG